jgi:FAD/FMN-containing dehydrogenase
MLAFDARDGTLECEAGVSIAEIIDTFLPKGFFPPVTPGTRFVTVGGAIAADVHGKNHHRDGSLGNFVINLKLLTASGEVLTCGPTENAEVFWATVGGMGLTGFIQSATLKLRPVRSAYVNVETRRAPNIDSALELFEFGDQGYLYSVAWIDCLAGGRSLGRSVLMRGDHAALADVPIPARDEPLSVRTRSPGNVPFNFPRLLLNPLTVGAFNELYYESHPDRRHVVPYASFFYPLDSLRNWNRLYGRRGFVQYQAFFPLQSSRRGLVELLEQVSASGQASFLAVLKSCGAADPALLSYLGPGHTLALDLPFDNRLRELASELDNTLLKHGGRLYLAKDACMNKEKFAAMYPNLERFRQVKARVDPQDLFVSAQARRVGIVDPTIARTRAQGRVVW